MHHKRGRPKNRRAGCLLCKPHKMNGAGRLKHEVHKIGFGRLRREASTEADLLHDDSLPAVSPKPPRRTEP